MPVSPEIQLRFILRSDELLGCTLEACIAEISLTLDYDTFLRPIDLKNFRSLEPRPDQAEVSLIRMVSELSWESLAKNLSKTKARLPDILKSKPESFHKNLFRPMVDSRMAKAIQFISENRIGLYYAQGPKISLKPLEFQTEPAEVSFHFDKGAGGLSYFISVEHNRKKLNLRTRPGMVLSENPCILLSGHVVYSVDGIDGKRIRPFLLKDRIDIPAHMEEKYFQTFVYQTTCRYPVNAAGFQVETLRPVPEPVLELTIDWQGEMVVILSFHYSDHEVLWGKEEDRMVSMDATAFPPAYEVTLRDRGAELDVYNFILGLGLNFKSGSALILSPELQEPGENGLGMVQFLSERKGLLDTHNIGIKQTLDSDYFIGNSGFESEVVEEGDWFDLRILIRVGGYEFPFTRLRDNILAGNRTYLLPDGKIFLIPQEWFGRFHDALALSRREGGKVRLHRFQFPLLEEMFYGLPTESKSLEGLVGRLMDSGAEIQSSTADILRPYQLAGVRWLVALAGEGFGGFLADDMGLGKTLQVLSMLDHLHNEPGFSGSSLVVMPVSILHNWENEIRKFTPGLSFYRMTGPDRVSDPGFLNDYDVILSTYGVVRNDIGKLEELWFSFVILDESQAVKNPDSETARSVKRLKSRNRMVLTGTPVENSITDLWSQMDFLNPGLLGSREMFNRQYAAPIDRGIDPAKTNRIRHLVRPFILRRTKEAVAPELPLLTVETRYCDPTEEQSAVYETRKSEIRNYLMDQKAGDGTTENRMVILSYLLELRLISNHPVLKDPDYRGSSGKTDHILSMVAEIVSEGHKILIFSQFVMHLDLIGGFLEGASIPFVSLTGSDRPEARRKAIDRFNQDPAIPVFLISLKAGGVGLNLTAADYVFILDPWWNPASELQAISRAHRIGQDKPVIAYKFITTGSIEEKVLTLQSRKQGLADRMINENLLDLSDPGMLAELLG